MVQEPSRMEILKRGGWTRRFTANEPRLSEAVAVYAASGYDVLLEPVSIQGGTAHPALKGTECTACFEGKEEAFRIIFTRPRKENDHDIATG